MSKPRSIQLVVRPPRRVAAANFGATHIGGGELQPFLDPFIGIDHFEMRGPFFAPHPHAGFSAVTWLLEESEVGFRNRDSLGHVVEIAPGELLWTCAGRGVIHDEFPLRPGHPVHGLQIFVNLAAAKKGVDPVVQHLHLADVPIVEGPGTRVRVMVGRSSGHTSPLVPPTDVTLLDATLAAGGRLEHVLPVEENVVVYVLGGAAEAAGRQLNAGDVAAFSQDGDRLLLTGVADTSRVVVFAGRPLREPLVAHGPFVMNNRAQIEQAVADYQAGRMGRLAPAS